MHIMLTLFEWKPYDFIMSVRKSPELVRTTEKRNVIQKVTDNTQQIQPNICI